MSTVFKKAKYTEYNISLKGETLLSSVFQVTIDLLSISSIFWFCYIFVIAVRFVARVSLKYLNNKFSVQLDYKL